ncbi:hypothetical protein DID73_01325 [Candidatus Marinamargulisbacteria bacterium SCGC AG-343-K17]|nr:hypothetical protein DID73_01325 [Candidatus Marinamargulisbacteria bacterium SCGC AG-343-K17]
MSTPKKVTPKTLDMSQLKRKERDAVQGAVSSTVSSKGSQKGMMDGPKRLELYKHIDIMVNICIDAAMKAAKGGSEDGRMSVDFGTMTYIITAKRIELIHKKSKSKMAYSVGRQEIVVNNTKPLPDKQCQKFVVWIKKLIDDWAKPKAESVCTWTEG